MARLTSKALIAMAGTAAMKARDYASKNPHKVEQALGKLQTNVSHRTRGKYDTHVDKGTDAVLKGLGLPGRGGPGGAAPTDPDPDTTEARPPHGLRDPVAPNPAPGTSDDPQPRRRDDDPAPLTPGERPHH